MLVPQSPGGTPQSVQDLHGTQVELAAHSPQPESVGGIHEVHREPLLRLNGVPSTVPASSRATPVIPSERFSVLSKRWRFPQC